MVRVELGTITTMVATYGRRLAEAMEHAGYDIARLASEMGISYQAVAKVLTGATRSFTAKNNAAAARLLGVNPDWLADGTGPRAAGAIVALESGGPARPARPVPVVGTARLGTNGYYEELQYPPGHGDGWVDSYSTDTCAYALRVKGDSMHPAIRHGSFIVAEPSRPCVPGEYVVLALSTGQKMVKELVIERPEEVVVESVNGGDRLTIEKSTIEKMHPVAAVVAASKWRPG